jgi:5-methyltetrahydropteroyltriglutamate--homocysteine methyltransferase
MPKLNPPFRADQVGSLLRTPEVKENGLLWKQGLVSASALRAIEDKAIAETVKKVESLGMQSITDGEFRRGYFHLDFLQQLEGVSVTGLWVLPL